MEKSLSVLGTRKRRIAALVTAVALVAASGGLAYAYWTSGGTGTGVATTGTSTAFTFTVSDPTGGPLTPGDGAEDVAFTVNNPAAGSQELSNVVVTVANADGSAWTAVTGCSAADYAVGTPTFTPGEIAGDDNTDGTVTITMNDLTTDQNACQGVTVPLYFVAS